MSATWDQFVKSGLSRARHLEGRVGEIPLEPPDETARRRMSELAYEAYAIAGPCLLVGAEDVGRLALTCERALDYLGAGVIEAEPGLPILASTVRTLVTAFESLAAPDRSGARTEGVPIEAARYELETLFPIPGKARGPAAPDVPLASLKRRDGQATAPAESDAPGPPPPSEEGRGEIWSPDVDDDMLELFFEEVGERIEALSVKLLDIEKRPEDAELLRDVFRDLHTLKGSSAMVGLTPMKELAHAAEDLVGQLRDGGRRADGPVIDALLAALDGLRDIASLAGRRAPIALDTEPILRRLRDPASATAAAPAAKEPPEAQAQEEATPAQGPRAPSTIRVDFDKLDRLLNLVGELVLGRDGLRGAISSLGALSTELSSDRPLTRHLKFAKRALSGGAARAVAGKGAALGGERDTRKLSRQMIDDLADELGRVERVLTDIAQELDHSSGNLDSVSAELRDSVMKLRMVPVGSVFRKHRRTVRDLAGAMGKRVRLELAGEETELDKLLVEALDEPLMHLVRNAVDHAIEPPEERAGAGKAPEGAIQLRAMHRGNQVIIEIEDDGKGIDPESVKQRALERDLCTRAELDELTAEQVLELIFRPGFSTAEVISEVSGRGVGMDVVRQTIVNRLKGTIDIRSEVGRGSTFTLRLPLTLAIIQVLLARAGGEVFAIPLDAVVRTTTCREEELQLIQDREVLTLRDRQVPLIRLSDVLELEADSRGAYAGTELYVVLTESGGELCGLVCDGLVGKKEIVIKSLGDILENVPCAAGATLLGDRCAIILDVAEIMSRALGRGVSAARRHSAAPAAPSRLEREPDQSAPHLLLAEDSDMIRESLRRLLVGAGYRVTEARDGQEAFELAKKERFDLVSTDVMMPRMDGYELTRTLRATPEYQNTPIVMVTSRGERIDRVRGFDAGVDDYITKPHDRTLLLRAISKLLGPQARKEPR